MKKVFWCDLHVHSNYSYDNSSKNTMEKNVVAAIAKGIDALCFTEHIELCHFDTFCDFPFEKRKAELQNLQQKYGDKIKLLLGFEMGSPHRHPKELEFLRSLEPDMIIGSVHFPAYYHKITQRLAPVDYYNLYCQEVRKMVEFGGFDVLGHADMPKKYNDLACDQQFLYDTLAICAQKGIVPEMNTASLRHVNDWGTCGKTMIDVDAVRHYAKMGGRHVVINSDSHSFDTVGCHFEQTYQQIKDVVSLCYFEKGKLIEIK